jgi:GDP/UDP-N,N'-diacetylbacillosamine 2-epimerase (hydrolysing)
MKRRICYITGTRADFSLMASTLRRAHADPRLDVAVCVTGMHLLEEFGLTVRDIEANGLRICGRVPVHLDGTTGAVMARAMGQALIGMTEVLEKTRPDLVVVLGDRGEMLAGALAALHLGIPVAHLHGGERSGTLDASLRHAISKLAHFHMVATRGARERLIRMGEREERVFVTGAPGLDGIKDAVTHGRAALCAAAGLDPGHPVALVVFHPVVQEADAAGDQMKEIVAALPDVPIQALCMTPNSDAGGRAIRAVLAQHDGAPGIALREHLARDEFVSWLAAADVMVGNSSAGIIEAASLGLAVVNVGSRQKDRERSGNVTDVPPVRAAIRDAIRAALEAGRREFSNIYGDGRAGERIVELLATLSLDREILNKTNAY